MTINLKTCKVINVCIFSAICVIGDFTDHVPNDLALNAVQQMIECAAANGKIVTDYILKGHRDVGTTACPGTEYYKLLQTWPHYVPPV